MKKLLISYFCFVASICIVIGINACQKEDAAMSIPTVNTDKYNNGSAQSKQYDFNFTSSAFTECHAHYQYPRLEWSVYADSINTFRFCGNLGDTMMWENCRQTDCDGIKINKFPYLTYVFVSNSVGGWNSFKNGEVVTLQYNTKNFCSPTFGYGPIWVDYPAKAVTIKF